MKAAILFAVPGTSSDEAAGAFRNIDRMAAERFGGVVRQWSFTSAGVRKKLARRGQTVDDPASALDRLRQQGVTHIAVQALHMVPGMEYGELRETIEEARVQHGGFARVVMGPPVLESGPGFQRTVEILLQNIPVDAAAGEVLVLVAHGSPQAEAQHSLAAAAALCRGVCPPVFLGALMPPPGLPEVLAACRAAAAKRAILTPLTIAAGDSAARDIAGPAPGSWQSVFAAAGIPCTTVMKGLGDYEAIVELRLDEIDAMLGTLLAA